MSVCSTSSYCGCAAILRTLGQAQCAPLRSMRLQAVAVAAHTVCFHGSAITVLRGEAAVAALPIHSSRYLDA